MILDKRLWRMCALVAGMAALAASAGAQARQDAVASVRRKERLVMPGERMDPDWASR